MTAKLRSLWGRMGIIFDHSGWLSATSRGVGSGRDGGERSFSRDQINQPSHIYKGEPYVYRVSRLADFPISLVHGETGKTRSLALYTPKCGYGSNERAKKFWNGHVQYSRVLIASLSTV